MATPSLRSAVLGFCLGALAVSLSGCGGGGGGPPAPPTPAPTPSPSEIDVPCTLTLTRGQCATCSCFGQGGSCQGDVSCNSCKSPYVWQNSSSGSGSCAIQCPEEPARPAQPKNMLDLNGVAWPAACFNGTEDQHVFVIGDWGGEGNPPYTFCNRAGAQYAPGVVNVIDRHAQDYVSKQISLVAPTSRPKYFLNVGDNFYPGGISSPGTCNAVTDKVDAAGSIVFSNVFEAIYTGDGVDGVEWWGVLGNHDFGGYEYSVHWDQNIFYTWHSPDSRWLTPALYWSRKVQYRDFTVDYFFVDSNTNDVFANPDTDQNHNICSRLHNAANAACLNTSIQSPDTCWAFFTNMWKEEMKWLENLLAESTAEWQIIVTHYPPTFEPCMTDAWVPFFEKYGVDLYISGHTHQQLLFTKDSEQYTQQFTGTPYIISGGGGGITSEILPTQDGVDGSYGFMDLTITKDTIKIDQYSHGGLEQKVTLIDSTFIAPRYPADATIVV